MSVDYQKFISGKSYEHIDAGFTVSPDDLSPELKDFQRDCVLWACRRGRAALFADTGLGKTIMQLAWAYAVQEHTDKPVLVVTPLCVAQQTVREGEKFGIDCEYIREPKFTNSRIHVTNYEMLKNFDPSKYSGIVLDESSILKGMDGKMRRYITEFGSTIPYRLSCTATPSPNDFMELGTQSEFLGIMSQVEMLATFFIHDGSDTSKWRLKGHGRSRFWEWLSTWSALIRNPGDLGYESTGYDLPPLEYENHVVETGVTDGLFVKVAQGLQERNTARRESIDMRVAKAAEIANSVDGACIVWCHLNDESQKLETLIDGSVQVTGSDSVEFKEIAINWFIGIGGYGKCKPKAKKNICACTDSETLTSGRSRRKTETDETQAEEKSMRKILNTELVRRRQLETSTKEIQKQGLTKDSNNMELTETRTGKYSKASNMDAPCVEKKTLDAKNKKGCMLTTATKQEMSEDCYAQTAIKDLESSRIAQSDYEKRLNISRKVIISKPRIYGYGLNLQHCNTVIFVGLSDSWEAFYQAVRRCWRFGQDKPVKVHIVTADTEGAVLANIIRKQNQNEQMGKEMAAIMSNLTISEIKGACQEKADYFPAEELQKPAWG